MTDSPVAPPCTAPSACCDPAPPPSSRPALLTLEDLTADVLWVRLLRVPALALSPARLGLSFFQVLLSGIILRLGLTLDAQILGSPQSLADNAARVRSLWASLLSHLPISAGIGAASTADAAAASPAHHPWHHAAWELLILCPIETVRLLPMTCVIAFPAALAVWLVFSGSVARSAACEIAHGSILSWTDSLSYAAARWRALLASVVLPIAAVWIIAAILTSVGGLLLRIPAIDVLAALLFPLAFIGAAVCVLIGVAYLLAGWLLVPAVVCEDEDAFDAIQRAYAYLFARPLRLVLYILSLIVICAATLGIARAAAGFTVSFAANAASSWAGHTGARAVRTGLDPALSATDSPALSALDPAPDATSDPASPSSPPSSPSPAAAFTELPATAAAASRIFRLWGAAVQIALFAFAASLLSCACSTLYLVMRRLADGQDVTDLYSPGRIEHEMQASLAARALHNSAVMGTPAPPATPPTSPHP